MRNLRSIGICALLTVSSAATAQVIHLPLNYNFNGMVHPGDFTAPNDPDGYRSISDRGLRLDGSANSLGTNPIIGFDGITYSIITTAETLDIVHLGNRNTVDGGNWAFDPNTNSDNIGTQPAWLPNPDQAGPQTTDVSGQGIVLDATGEVAVIYQISNGGGSFDITLTFSDLTSVTVTAQGPDWFQNQSPGAAGPGLVSQTQLGVYAGSANVDSPTSGATLNVAEAVISVPELIADGFPDVSGKTLASISFSNRTNANAGYAIIAATVRTGLAPPANDDCANATPITDGTTAGSNARATGTDISPCGSNDTTSVWYAYTAPATGTAQASTCGGALDTTLTIYSSCGGSVIACDDNACGFQSLVQWNAQMGVTYLIRLAGEEGAEGNFLLNVASNVAQYDSTPLPLTYNFNGIVHAGEAGLPDDPDGFRSMSDRAINRSAYPGGFLGTTGIAYDVSSSAGVLDMVHVGNRNTVDGGNWMFDPNSDGDDIGTQPTWLANADQSGPQSSDVSGASVTLDASSEIGVIYNVSNGGGEIDMQLGFSDATSVTVTLSAPDWFGDQVPDPNGGPGVALQTQMAVVPGTGAVDFANPDFPLNVVEAVVTVDELLNDGVGDVAGKTLSSVTFGNRSNTNAGYAVYAVTVRSAAGAPDCPGDLDNDNDVDLTDLALFLSSFGCTPPASCTGDIDGDGDTDLTDLALFLSAFGRPCP